jgi:hypothetical protein
VTHKEASALCRRQAEITRNAKSDLLALSSTQVAIDAEVEAWEAVADALESIPTLQAAIAAEAEMGRELREALKRLAGNVEETARDSFGHPNEAFSVSFQTEDPDGYFAWEFAVNALALPISEAGKLATEQSEKAGLLDWLFTFAKVAKNGWIEFRIPLPKSADWDGTTCVWDEQVFIEALRAAKESSRG